MAQAYPLHWPQGFARTERPQSSQFRTPVNTALNNVTKSLKQFASDSGKGMTNITVSSNYTLGDQHPKDSGVAVYFTWDGISTCIAVDRYIKLEDNLQAILHCIEAERVKLRHGGLNLVRAAFRGYAALPPPSPAKDWRTLLRCGPNATRADIDQSYRSLSARLHPDKPGLLVRQSDKTMENPTSGPVFSIIWSTTLGTL